MMKEAEPKMMEFAMECVRKAAEAGCERAFLPYGVILRRRSDGDDNPAGAAVWLRKAAELGDTDAMAELADMLLEHSDIKQSPGEPEKWLTLSSRSGNEHAKRILREWEERTSDYRASAKSGNSEGMERLGNTLIGLPCLARELGEGVDWLRKAGASGRFNLAKRLLHGNGLPQNEIEGERLLRETAAESEKAKFALAKRLLDGSRSPQDREDGERLLRELASAGYDRAVLELHLRLREGRGLEKNLPESTIWIQKWASIIQHQKVSGVPDQSFED